MGIFQEKQTNENTAPIRPVSIENTENEIMFVRILEIRNRNN
jgi:hypothetical protein